LVEDSSFFSFLRIGRKDAGLAAVPKGTSSSAENLDNCIGLERKHLMDA
jgi:hypothetical protein